MDTGLNDCAIARALGVPRETIREWRHQRHGARDLARRRRGCPICDGSAMGANTYAYLFGLYLGDGCLSLHRRKVYRLRVTLDARYRHIIDECAHAMAAVSGGRRVGRQPKQGCVDVWAYWKHWPCVFPQHGRGHKHLRSIELAPWQRAITQSQPASLLRGLIQSDGARTANKVRGVVYPRYEFKNLSSDILRLFCQACDDYGVSFTRPSEHTVSIARTDDVLKLDLVIGPKT